MNRNIIFRIILYGTSTVVVSEICYNIYCYIRDECRKRKKNIEINEVLMFNELSESCAKNHLQSPKIVSLLADLPPEMKCSNQHCSHKNINRIVSILNAAVYSIDVAIYTFTSHLIANALKRAHRRGVSIRIVSDLEMSHSSGSSIKALAGINIPVRGPSTTYMMHHKFCIIDGEPRVQELKHINQIRRKTEPCKGMVISGSVNWTKQGFGGNWENSIITSNEEIVKQFQVEFERMWLKFKVLQLTMKPETSTS